MEVIFLTFRFIYRLYVTTEIADLRERLIVYRLERIVLDVYADCSDIETVKYFNDFHFTVYLRDFFRNLFFS